jgi:hypothetical protein
MATLLKSFLHNFGVVLVGFALAYLGAIVDSILGFRAFTSTFVTAAGWLLVAVCALITCGPYQFSRNPPSAETCSSSLEPP